MPSPFPGMNPYLENPSVWHDFHEKFMPMASEFLVPQVRPHFIVQIDQHVYIHDLSLEERTYLGRPDAHIEQNPNGISEGAAVTTLEAPTWATVPVLVDQEKVSFLEIRDREDRELITVIELLSPTNKKPGSDHDAFLAKRSRYLASGVHYIEIDLLRGQPRMPIENLAHCDYYVMVSRWELRPRVGVWPVRLRDSLPTIPIPLRGEHPDARLDLQTVLHRIYDASGYEDYIHAHLPLPPLHPEDAKWAESLIARKS